MSFLNLVRLSKIKKISLSDYAHVNKGSKNEKKMTINVMMVGHDIYDRFTMELMDLTLCYVYSLRRKINA
jgi:hypothetical protein